MHVDAQHTWMLLVATDKTERYYGQKASYEINLYVVQVTDPLLVREPIDLLGTPVYLVQLDLGR